MVGTAPYSCTFTMRPVWPDPGLRTSKTTTTPAASLLGLLVLPHATTLQWDLGDTHGTVALRMPQDPVALAVLTQTGPLAVSSANRSGMPPAGDAAEAARQLGTAVAVYLDGGPTTDTVPSTIVDLTTEVPRVLRAGAVALEQLQVLLPDLQAGA